jgi:hypothetical protein
MRSKGRKLMTPEMRRIYWVWLAARQRCGNPRNKQFKDYGGRGIIVCPEWAEFEAFLADMGMRPTSEHTLERKNNAEGYNKSNCIWATQLTQAKNKRHYRRRREDLPPGVSIDSRKTIRPYVARIQVDGKQKFLGAFDTKDEASNARRAALLEYGFGATHDL